jgi:hypothetical protein
MTNMSNILIRSSGWFRLCFKKMVKTKVAENVSKVCVQKYLFTSADPLHTKIFSILNVRSRHYNCKIKLLTLFRMACAGRCNTCHCFQRAASL